MNTKKYPAPCSLLPATCIALVLCLFSCSNESINYKKGEQKYALGEYYEASLYFKRSYSRTPSKEKAKRAQRAWMLGECYRPINYPAKAVAAYQNALRNWDGAIKAQTTFTREEYIDSMAQNYHIATFRLAHQQLKMGNYKGARQNFETFLSSLIPVTHADSCLVELAHNGLQSCELGPAWKASPNDYTVKREPLFNSRRSDYSPMLFGDEYDQLLITSTRTQSTGDDLNSITGVKSADMFLAKKDENKKWKQPDEIDSEINTEYDEGVSCMSADGRTMYFTRCSSDPDYPRYAEIYTSTRSDASWGKATKCEIIKDSLSSFAHPAMSPNGRYLYFVSDMPGGVGGFDIWRAEILDNGMFVGMENLGRPINTPGDEMFPVFRPNGDLYFSSDGHPGMGGLDIFIAHYDSLSGWSVENQAYPLNSPMDDFGMTFDGLHNRGYFSSSRNDGKGWEHIYSFYRPEIQQIVTGWVYEQDGYELPEAQVYIIGDDGTNEKVSVKGDGSFTKELRQGVRYIFLGSCPGYLNVRNSLDIESGLTESYDYTLQFPLPPLHIPVLIENIFYEFDKADLTPASTEALNKLVTMMEENPHITIELSAHCDYKGRDEYNERLSQRRAESVVRFMTEHGVKADRMTAVGYGESRPKVVKKKVAERNPFLTEGDTLTEEYIKKLPEDQQEVCNSLNRRTEFRVLRTTYGLSL